MLFRNTFFLCLTGVAVGYYLQKRTLILSIQTLTLDNYLLTYLLILSRQLVRDSRRVSRMRRPSAVKVA